MNEAEIVLARVTTGVAVTGVTSPAWLPVLDTTSRIAASLVPILSAIWLIIQIWRAFLKPKITQLNHDNHGRVTTPVLGGISAFALAAAAFIGPLEGLSLKAYPDALARNLPTVCYGETRGVRLGDVYTKAECDAMLAIAAQEFHDKLARCLPTLPAQPQGVRVALTSWVYNVGPGAACSSTLVRLAKQDNWQAACEQLPRWNRASGMAIRGLSNRRGKERTLCLASLK